MRSGPILRLDDDDLRLLLDVHVTAAFRLLRVIGGYWRADSAAKAAVAVLARVAWLLGPGARDVTGRVLEAGNGQISVPGPWQPGTPFPLPPLMSPRRPTLCCPASSPAPHHQQRWSPRC